MIVARAAFTFIVLRREEALRFAQGLRTAALGGSMIVIADDSAYDDAMARLHALFDASLHGAQLTADDTTLLQITLLSQALSDYEFRRGWSLAGEIVRDQEKE